MCLSMMLMIIKIVSGDSKLQKGRRGTGRGQHKAVFCSGDVLIADRRWGHRRYTRITRTRDGLPAPTSFSAACSAATLRSEWQSVAGAKNSERFCWSDDSNGVRLGCDLRDPPRGVFGQLTIRYQRGSCPLLWPFPSVFVGNSRWVEQGRDRAIPEMPAPAIGLP